MQSRKNPHLCSTIILYSLHAKNTRCWSCCVFLGIQFFTHYVWLTYLMWWFWLETMNEYILAKHGPLLYFIKNKYTQAIYVIPFMSINILRVSTKMFRKSDNNIWFKSKIQEATSLLRKVEGKRLINYKSFTSWIQISRMFFSHLHFIPTLWKPKLFKIVDNELGFIYSQVLN